MICKKDEKGAALVLESLMAGKIVVIPTDTVYGFSGLVLEEDIPFDKGTDAQIRAIKGRSETKPLIQLIGCPEDIKKYTDDDIPQTLLSKWPGALTIIVNTKKSHPLYKRYPTIAFRCPGDLWLRQIVIQAGAPIYSTSVNRSGCPVLETVPEIAAEFEEEVALIVDDGDKKGALPSTLVAMENGLPKVLRQGAVEIKN
ncbi:MAG: L-threonylcarbamoyladenylate synthase [Treponema sp.]|nr:L-threonylcarbamoyladenylate synthase [Treponema sp.]